MGSPFQRAFSGKSPLNKHGKLQRKLDKVNKGKIGSEGQGGIDYELKSQLQDQIKAAKAAHSKEQDNSIVEEERDNSRADASMSRKASPLNLDKNRNNEIKELSLNKAMKGRRTMKNRPLKSASKVEVESSKPSVKIVEKAKPVTIPKPKPKKTLKETIETRARRSIKAPSKDQASKMNISRKSKYKK